jgi:hypothetical protein
MIAAPMLADFLIRWAFGLAFSILMIPWRSVPLPFFRTQAHVMLGLLVLGALDQARAGGQSWAFWAIVVAAISAYASAVGWGSGLPYLGVGTAVLATLATGAWLINASGSGDPGLWLANASSRLCSGILLGATLTAMLLGHYYLTAPAMTIQPLARALLVLACALGARCMLAAGGFVAHLAGSSQVTAAPDNISAWIFLAVRWGLGFVAAAVSIFMAWKTAAIRSTQSATGILYITMIFVLFGELTSLFLARPAGFIP